MRVITDLNENSRLAQSRKARKNDRFIEGSPSDLNVRRIVFLAFFGVLLPVVQEAFFNELRVFGVKPNLAVIFLVTMTIVMNEREALFFGLGQGLVLDVLYGKVIGFYALLFTVLGFLLALICRDRFKKSVWPSLTVAPVVFFVYTFLESLFARTVTFLFILNGTGTFYGNFQEHLLTRILPVSLYNLAIFVVFLYPVRMLWKVLALSKNRKVAFNRRYDDDTEI